MSTISTIEFNLTTLKTYNETTQAFEDTTLTGNLYTVEGVTDATGVTLRRLSMAELVMVVCLARAAEKERAVIDIMSEMENTTSVLNALTDIEKQLLDGTSLTSITGEWTYNGTTYTSAVDLLGDLDIIHVNRNRKSLVSIAEKLQSSSVFDINETYSWNGSNRSAYDVLKESGCLEEYISGNVTSTAPKHWQTYFILPHDTEEAYELAQGLIRKGSAELDSDDILTLGAYYNISIVYFEDVTSAEAGYEVESMFYNGSVKSMIRNKINGMPIYVESTTDQIITAIESKMDSMNSFSQQKMIELQSETNKRDQAYDMITNILKSMNTVQVGNANNI